MRRRIRRAEDFRVVMRAGSRAASRTLVVHAHGGRTSEPARAGFVVGRSVGGSVIRHRVTRQLRHLMRVQLEGLPPGIDIVVRALPPAGPATSAELSADLASGVRRALSKLGHDARTVSAVSQ
ncbi:MAG TPA: ribonuclease P protein component [Motilibacterales bacterium]|nr:ribonuclease P protein component [Motilibacterales bacterium]